MKRLENFWEKREIQGKNKKPLSESVWKTDNGMLLKNMNVSGRGTYLFISSFFEYSFSINKLMRNFCKSWSVGTLSFLRMWLRVTSTLFSVLSSSRPISLRFFPARMRRHTSVSDLVRQGKWCPRSQSSIKCFFRCRRGRCCSCAGRPLFPVYSV